VSALWEIANCLNSSKSFREGMKLLNESHQLIRSNRIEAFTDEIHKRIADQYKLMGDRDNYEIFNEKYLHVHDSITKVRELKSISALSETPNGKQNGQAASSELSMMTSVVVTTALAIVALLFLVVLRGKIIQRKGGHTPVPVADVKNDTAVGSNVKYVQAIKHAGEALIPVENIFWFATREKQSAVFNGEELLPTRYTISELEEILGANENFVRINRQVIVNVNYMLNYSFWEKDKYIVRMKDVNRTEFVMSRSRLKSMKDKLGVKSQSIQQAPA
jgi:hypothetical protein